MNEFKDKPLPEFGVEDMDKSGKKPASKESAKKQEDKKEEAKVDKK